MFCPTLRTGDSCHFYSQNRSCVYFINGLMNSFMDIDFILRFNNPFLSGWDREGNKPMVRFFLMKFVETKEVHCSMPANTAVRLLCIPEPEMSLTQLWG